MIDFGLVASLLAAVGIPTLLATRWSPLDGNGSGFLDDVIGPLAAALVVGRLVTLALDDPNSIGSLSDMLVVRSGVEFWPGVAAAVAATVWQTTRADGSPMRRLAALAPLALVGYAAYEAACVFRDGCLGPVSPVGLQPPGLQVTMLPVGWLMGAAVLVGATALHRLRHRLRPAVVVSAAVALVAAVRAVGSVWLPHIGGGLTRQHRTSIAVAVVAVVASAVASIRAERAGRVPELVEDR